MEYTVLSYDSRTNIHTIRDKNQTFRVDLCVDASWDEYLNFGDTCTNEDVEKLCKSIIGKTISIEELIPIDYFAKNTKTI